MYPYGTEHHEHSHKQEAIALPYYSTSCYLETGLAQHLDSASLRPANKQETISEKPTGTSSAWLLISSTLGPN